MTETEIKEFQEAMDKYHSTVPRPECEPKMKLMNSAEIKEMWEKDDPGDWKEIPRPEVMKKCCSAKQRRVEGIVILYTVTHVAESALDEIIERNFGILEKQGVVAAVESAGYKLLVLPVRSGESRIEVLNFGDQ